MAQPASQKERKDSLVMLPGHTAARSIHTCSHCGSVLLSTDHVGGPAGLMDRALTHHLSAACKNLVNMTREHMLPLLHEFDDNPHAEVAARVCWPDDEPALVFCARHAELRDIALRLVATKLAVSTGGIDAASKDGLTALHLGCMRNDAELVAALCEAGADASLQSQDNAAAQLPGGRTPLHCCSGVEAVSALRSARGWHIGLLTLDWQGSLPAQAAALRGASRVAVLLAAETLAVVCAQEAAGRPVAIDADDAAELARLTSNTVVTGGSGGSGGSGTTEEAQEAQLHAAFVRVDIKERARLRLDVAGRLELHEAHLLRALFTPDECAWLVAELTRSAAHDGWQTARHRHYATTDAPLWRAAKAAAWVRRRLGSTVLPAFSELFGIARHRLALRESFVVRYEQALQPSLVLHKDATLLSCNVLLNDAASFDGGGTCFAQSVRLSEWGLASGVPDDSGATQRRPRLLSTHEEATVVRGGRGDCLLHCGQLSHGAHAVTRGTRLVLVCFIDELYSP